MASINVTYSDITATYDLPDEIGEEVVIGTSEDCSIDMPESIMFSRFTHVAAFIST